MRSVAVFLALAAISAVQPHRLAAQASAADQPKGAKLTLKQVLALVSAAPDQVVANEVHSRGISATVSRKDVDRVQEAGGGPRTLAALRALIPMATLVIRSDQDNCEVLIDGKPRGNTGPSRQLAIHDAEPGPHTVVVRKARYSPSETKVDVVPGKANEVNAALELSVGTLTVTTNAPNAQIQIEGVNLNGRSASNIELSPGTYAVHVTAPRFVGVTKDVALKAGDALQLNIPLTIDPTFVRSALTRAQSEEQAGRYDIAIKIATDALRIQPGDGQALDILAMSSFYDRDYNTFVQAGKRALGAGAGLEIPVVHHHTLKAAHRGLLKLTARTIAYDPSGEPGEAAFQVPLSAVRSSELKQDERGQRYLVLKVADPGSRKQQTLVFADYRAVTQAMPNGVSVLTAPVDGPQEITSVATLVQADLRNAH